MSRCTGGIGCRPKGDGITPPSTMAALAARNLHWRFSWPVAGGTRARAAAAPTGRMTGGDPAGERGGTLRARRAGLKVRHQRGTLLAVERSLEYRSDLRDQRAKPGRGAPRSMIAMPTSPVRGWSDAAFSPIVPPGTRPHACRLRTLDSFPPRGIPSRTRPGDTGHGQGRRSNRAPESLRQKDRRAHEHLERGAGPRPPTG